MRRNEARQLNHQEVVEEDRKSKLPSNWESKQKWAQYKLEEDQKYEDAAKRGEDYSRIKLLSVSAEEAERMEKKKKRKNPDIGFSDYEAATVRQYQRLVKQMKPDQEAYQAKKEQLGEAFYPTKDTIIHGLHKDSKEGIDRMVEDLEKQIDKRNKYSRRRRFNDDEDIDYINERNMKFNKKLDRFYGKYTAEIKQNLERGTAV